MPRRNLYEGDADVHDVEKILDVRILKKKIRVFTQYLVKWKGYSDEHNSWIYMSNVSKLLIKEFNEKNAALLERGGGISITEVEANRLATHQTLPVSHAEAEGRVTRSALRRAVTPQETESRVEPRNRDKSTQIVNYTFERYDYD